MRVVVAGESTFTQEIARLSTDAGHDTQVFGAVEDYDASVGGRLTDHVAQCDIAIELQNQSVEAKQEHLQALSKYMPRDALILSLTLATGATEAASWVANPQRLVGFGLLPPLTTPGMVELAGGLQTNASYLEQAQAYWTSLQLQPVVVSEGPGLVRARTVCCLINEASTALMEGVASATDIDVAMKLGTNYPYGPLQWADIIGVDNVYAVMKGLYREWGEDRYRPAPLLKRMVLAGRLGRKSGQGFFTYGPDGNRVQAP